MTAVSSDWERVDASWLPEGWIPPEEGDGWVAEFFPDGQLRRYGFVKAGHCLRELVLEEGEPAGRQIDHDGSGGTSDWVTHRDGMSENFNAWSDNERPFPESWEKWVRRSIRIVAGV